MRILITAFEAFGGRDRNVSLEVLGLLPRTIGGARINTLTLPVERGVCVADVLKAAALIRPDVILSLGEAAGRPGITVERVAVNLEDYRIPDNGGNQPRDRRIVPDGPDALFSRLPARGMAECMEAAGVPAALSYTAGTFVCNHLFYGLLHEFRLAGPRCGFVHLPAEGFEAAKLAQAVAAGLEWLAQQGLREEIE